MILKQIFPVRFFRPLRLCLVLVCSCPGAWAAPLKVFVLAGQSNMQGHAHVRTLPHLGMDPRTAPLLDTLVDADGKPRVSESVSIAYLSDSGERHGRLTAGFGANEEKIGPEWAFGVYMQESLGEPILIIKTAWGGKSLHTDFRPPGAGPYEFNPTQVETFKNQGKDMDVVRAEKAEATGHYYRLMVDYVKRVLGDVGKVCPDYRAEDGYELAGFVWFQGWNDMVDRGVYPDRDKAGGYALYSELLAQFIRDVRRDLGAPELPFVIGVMGVNGPVADYLPGEKRYAGIHRNFREAMAAPAALPEFRGNVAVVRTERFWDPELTRLGAREAEVKQQVRREQKEGKLSRAATRKLEEELLAEALTDEERRILEIGVSNAEYHYLGSAKILAQIGRAFAEAMRELGVK